MDQARIHSKGAHEYKEDLLTGMILGGFSYLPPDVGIAGFLRGKTKMHLPVKIEHCSFYFWPEANKVPDALIELKGPTATYHVVVEAKYKSGLSSQHQLVNQFKDLMKDPSTYKYLSNGSWKNKLVLKSKPEHRFLLYLTANIAEPIQDLAHVRKEADDKNVFWTSWYDVADYLDENRSDLDNFPYERIANDLYLLLKKLGFVTFRGVRTMDVDLGGFSGSFWNE